MRMYLRFGGMLLAATVVMYGAMYLNTYRLEHVFFSETRAWMALLMGAVMALVMLPFMWRMYSNKAVNAGIIGAAIAVFAVSLYLVRSQRTVDDVAWLKAMIPHHSVAILTSERANIRDPRARELASQIIEGQRQEIDEMKRLIVELDQRKFEETQAAAD